MENMWLNKSDLYQDLGLGVSSDVEVIENRPRTRVEEDSGDIANYLLYGSKSYHHQGRENHVYDDGDHVEPDLNNITNMVKMVKEAEQLPQNSSPRKERKNEGQIKITKPKLNPDVQEFVPGQQRNSATNNDGDSSMSRSNVTTPSSRPSPRNGRSPKNRLSPSHWPSISDNSRRISNPKNPSTSAELIPGNKLSPRTESSSALRPSTSSELSPAESNIPSPVDGSRTKPDPTSTHQDIIDDLKGIIDSVAEEEKDALASILKEEIKSRKQEKTKRNVAINTLMKLYTSKSPSVSNKSVEADHNVNKINLLKPNDFLTDNIPSKIENKKENAKHDTEVDPYTKQVSINKVEKWLESTKEDKPQETESPENSKHTSGSIAKPAPISSPRPSTAPQSSFKRYVPSADLDKKIERLNAMKKPVKQEKKIMTIWDRAEEQMKALDEKKRLVREGKIANKNMDMSHRSH